MDKRCSLSMRVNEVRNQVCSDLLKLTMGRNLISLNLDVDAMWRIRCPDVPPKAGTMSQATG